VNIIELASSFEVIHHFLHLSFRFNWCNLHHLILEILMFWKNFY